MLKRKIDPNNLIWKSEYNVGDYKIDLEHQSLFKLAKKALNIRTMENDEKEIIELKNVIRSLYEYVSTHFKNEEIYMKKIGYPELSIHKIEHIEILETLNIFVKTLNDLTIDDIETELYKFIEDYFIEHIVEQDMIIGLWANPLAKLRRSTKWKQEYETGNVDMDNEHKRLFEILDEAFMEIDDEKRDKKIKIVLNHLYDFIRIHFKNEEDFMQHINYPDINEHIKIHKHIIKSCNQLLSNVNSTNSELFEKELAKLIDDHLIGHILNEDKKITEFEKTIN